jgi:pimeloyl-ACP methyl ester carboxylesterase
LLAKGDRLRRILIGLAALIVAAPIAGWIYQAVAEARDDARHPPPGKLVDVDGHRMHIFCQGHGNPTVIVEQGIGAQSLGWAPLNERMSTVTTVCAYDRAGMGYSDLSITRRLPRKSPADCMRCSGKRGSATSCWWAGPRAACTRASTTGSFPSG